MNTTPNQYKNLVRKPKSSYKQLFVKDHWFSARTLYCLHMDKESPLTPAQIAHDFDLPLEAVFEAIAYCQADPPEIREDQEMERAMIAEVKNRIASKRATCPSP